MILLTLESKNSYLEPSNLLRPLFMRWGRVTRRISLVTLSLRSLESWETGSESLRLNRNGISTKCISISSTSTLTIEIVKYLYIQCSNWYIEVYFEDVKLKSNHKTSKLANLVRAERIFMFGILLQLDIWLEIRRHPKK
mgnify:CR=1 FL=1